MIRDSAIDVIREGLEKRKKKQAVKEEYIELIRDKAARKIQGAFLWLCE